MSHDHTSDSSSGSLSAESSTSTLIQGEPLGYSSSFSSSSSHDNHIHNNMSPPPSQPSKTLPKPPPQQQQEQITFLSLPQKPQLLILFLSRLVDFLQIASLQAYIFYQLSSINPSLPVSTISYQAGILQGCYTAAQIATAIVWGKVADRRSGWFGGRKTVLLVALCGTGASCLGYGFSTSFAWAAFWRVVGGGVNGSVGIIRTMISEITVEKKFQSRAFLLLPLSFNVASLIGPILGGLLADPVANYPALFSQDAVFGFQWMKSYPYAFPSVINAFFLFLVAATVFFGLEETLKSRRDNFDIGLYLAQHVTRITPGRSSTSGYRPLNIDLPLDEESNDLTLEMDSKATGKDDKSKQRQETQKRNTSEVLPFRRIWTKNVVFTLITCGLFDFHMGAFVSLWALLLSSPRFDYNAGPDTATHDNAIKLPFKFSGGLGMPASSVGFATAIIGGLGMILQFSLYPSINARLGLMKSFRYSIVLFPLAYFLAPYLSILPTSSAPPAQADGVLVWFGLTLVLFLQVMARTFALPASIILINNCSPHPSVLGTIHGLGQSTSAAARTIGPVVAGYWYGWGDKVGIVGVSWWGVSGVALACCITATWIYEGSGHEIMLPSELLDAGQRSRSPLSSQSGHDDEMDLTDLIDGNEDMGSVAATVSR